MTIDNDKDARGGAFPHPHVYCNGLFQSYVRLSSWASGLFVFIWPIGVRCARSMAGGKIVYVRRASEDTFFHKFSPIRWIVARYLLIVNC